jgi:hypothetical protein
MVDAEHGAGAAKVLAGCAAGSAPASALAAAPTRLGASTLAPASLPSLGRLAMTSATHRALAFIPRRVSPGSGREPS